MYYVQSSWPIETGEKQNIVCNLDPILIRIQIVEYNKQHVVYETNSQRITAVNHYFRLSLIQRMGAKSAIYLSSASAAIFHRCFRQFMGILHGILSFCFSFDFQFLLSMNQTFDFKSFYKLKQFKFMQ